MSPTVYKKGWIIKNRVKNSVWDTYFSREEAEQVLKKLKYRRPHEVWEIEAFDYRSNEEPKPQGKDKDLDDFASGI